jgi:lipopolysaccharide transport system permease protein
VSVSTTPPAGAVEGGNPKQAPPPALRTARLDVRQFRELVVHLARREVAGTHRGTLLGWTWPLVRQLVQLAVLVFVFSKVIALNIPDYPVFVFSGLIAWSWFATSMSGASRSLLSGRHLVFQPRFPSIVLPAVASAVPLVDVAMAFPVLLFMLVLNGHVPWTIALFPALLIVQLLFTAGLAWIIAATSVYLRDVPNLVGVVLLLMFYVTPVYFSLGKVPPEYQSLLRLNPMATIIESYRSVLLGAPFPAAGTFAWVALGSAALAAAGYLLFRRLEPGFVDEL